MFKFVTEEMLEEKMFELKQKMREELRVEVGYEPINPLDPFTKTITIREKYEQLRKDFEELDQKVDRMEKYLEIEYVELEGKITHDMYAESVDTKEYRKLDTFKTKKK